MNEMLAYSIHLGNDKNKTKKAKEIAKNKEYKRIPVAYELYSDMATPIEVLRILKEISKHCYMLESVEDSQKWGRYSFLGFDPLLEFTCQNGCVQIKGDSKFEDSSKLTDDDKVIIETNNPGEVIKDLVRQNKSPKLTNLPPFTGGFVGYFAYDYIKYAEPSINLDAENQDQFKDIDLMLFDTVVAFLAGAMIIPAVYAFMGTEGMSSGPSLMFVSLPKVFAAMGAAGNIIGTIFFAMVLFAAITSAVSVMEAVVSCIMDAFHTSRTKAGTIEGIFALIVGIIVCLGYNKLYFEFKLPNGSTAQILDIMDYISNNLLMPIVALATCILVGWVIKPKTVIEEVEKSGCKMGRKRLYTAMVKVIAPIFLILLLLQTLGIMKL